MVAECLDLNKPRSCKYGRKKKPKKKIDIYAVSVHDCTQEQNGSPYFSFPSFDNAFFTVNSSVNAAGDHLAGGSFMEKE